MPRVEKYAEMWAADEPVGAYWWNTGYKVPCTSQLAVIVIVPDTALGERGVMKFLNCVVDQSASEEKGLTYQWDGNKDAPTLEGMIAVRHVVNGQIVEGWKGFLKAGALVDAV